MKRNIDIEGFYTISISFSQTIRPNALEATQNRQEMHENARTYMDKFLID